MRAVLNKDKKEQEKKLISIMIDMYRSFKGREMSDDELDELFLYASKRIETCIYRRNDEKSLFAMSVLCIAIKAICVKK